MMTLIGWLIRKKGIIDGNAKGMLTEIVLDVILPCNIIASFKTNIKLDVLGKFALLIVIAVLAQVICYIICRFAYNSYDLRKSKVLRYATLVSNSGFLGLPMAEGTFGSLGLMYASIFIIPTRVIMWTAGLSQFTDNMDRRAAVKKVAVHPCMLGVYVGMFFMLTGLKLPSFIDDTITGIGRCTTPMTMLLIGSIIAEVEDLTTMVTRDVVYFTLIRIVLIPGMIFMSCKLAGIDRVITGVSVLLAGMPAGSTTAILASKYDGDYIFGTKLVVFSTIMSLLSVPVWCMLLSR